MSGLVVLLLVAVTSGDASSSLPCSAGWTATRHISSPHATQAAAADTGHVYAISNTTIAKYNRDSGQLVSTATTDDTQHLNSGFFHDGKLWCAHSNYPAMPHESDIRVYDPEENTLSVYHVFSEPPGSLVWCIVKEGRWWCCFAHYGDDNHRTVLIEYEADGFDRERQRFTFPDAVIADWDGMSGSGGIWDGDSLLVSHHHFRVLYRLQIPEKGSTLRFIEALHCPFPGQGFARDPVTDGLVGIDRYRRAIVYAEK